MLRQRFQKLFRNKNMDLLIFDSFIEIYVFVNVIEGEIWFYYENNIFTRYVRRFSIISLF